MSVGEEDARHDAAMKRIARRRRITIAVVLVLCPVSIICSVFFGIWTASWGLIPDPKGPTPGALSFAPGLERTTFELPSYFVEMNPDAGVISIVDKENTETVVRNVPGLAFVRVTAGYERVKESRGLFRLSEYQILDFPLQEIAEASLDTEDGPPSVLISGDVRLLPESAGGHPYTCRISEFENGVLNIWSSTSSVDFLELKPRVQLLFETHYDEHFLGFGEQYNQVDFTGKSVPVLVSEQGIGRGLQPISFFVDLLAGAAGDAETSYAPLPVSVTSDFRRFEFHATPYAECDLRAPGLAAFKTHGNAAHVTIDKANSPPALLGLAARRHGSMPPLPDWIISGAIVGLQGGTARVREEFAALKALDVPMAAFWLQDWCGQRKTSFGKQLWWNWELDRDRYPNWEAMRDELAADNVRIMAYVNPFLVDIAGKTKHTRNLYREALDLGYLAVDKDGKPHSIPNTDFSAGMLDLQREDVRDWMADVLRKQVIGMGVSGWMADYGESLPWDIKGQYGAAFEGGEIPVHNSYPEMWSETNQRACEEDPDLVYFMRSASAASVPRTRLFWTGDQLVTWDAFDGMKTSVTALMSSGLSGMVFNHSDIGGYTTISSPIKDYHRSKELLMRWMELNAFTVVFRTHEGNDPDKNAQFYTDDETMAQFARMAKVYAAWFPYRKELVREGSELGLPVVRHPWIHYWEDPEVLKIVYQQFMVGSEFMVAPVLEPGMSRVTIYLPKGRWIHLWTGKAFGGDTGVYAEVDAPMGYPAVFYKQDSPQGIAFHDALDAQGLLTGYPAN